MATVRSNIVEDLIAAAVEGMEPVTLEEDATANEVVSAVFTLCARTVAGLIEAEPGLQSQLIQAAQVLMLSCSIPTKRLN